MKSNNIKYLPAVDHIRAYAALLILLYHIQLRIKDSLMPAGTSLLQQWPKASNPLAAILIEGHTAVALFIVLSGFIFTFGVYGQGGVYWQFMRNRVLRLYPLLLVLLFVGLHSFRRQFTFSYFAQTLLGISNAEMTSPFGTFSAMFWAIAVEMQFYLIFPFLISIVHRRGPLFLLGMVGIAILLRYFSQTQGGSIRDLSYFTIVGRIDQFLFGMMAGIYFRKSFQPGKRWDVIFFVGLIAVCLAAFVFNRAGGWPVSTPWKLIVPTIEAGLWTLVILGYFSFARFLPASLSKWITMLGTISYSLYLLHPVVIDTATRQHWFSAFTPGRAVLIGMGVLVPLLIAFSALTYFFIEKPFLEMRGTYKKALPPA